MNSKEDADVEARSHFIELSFNNRTEKLYVPILPEAIELKKKGRGQTFDIVGLGEINVIHSRELAEIGWQSFFPAASGPYLSINPLLLHPPEHYVKLINGWMEKKYPCRFTMKAPHFTMTLPVSIEQFDRRETAGSGGDIEYSLLLKEYRFYAPSKIISAVDASGKDVLKKEAPQRSDERVPEATYTLKSGDTLWKVAQLMLGDGSRWKEIQQLNGLTDAQLTRLQPGQVLKLPERR